MADILIADDHAIVRMGIRFLLERSTPGIRVTEVDNFSEILKQVKGNVYDLVILDINIPGGNNVKMVEQIRIHRPELPVLIFTSYDERIYGLPYLQAGADGFVSKNASEKELEKAISKIAENKKYVSPTLQENVMNSLISNGKSLADPLTRLSKREMDVANLLIKGYGTAEISNILNLQLSTISTFKSRIFTKMDVRNLVELITKMGVSA